MKRDVLLERFFTSMVSGDRAQARQIVDEVLDADCPADRILTRLIWPTIEQIQSLHRGDQLSRLAHHYATRLMRTLAEQMQLRLEQAPRNGKKVLAVSGDDEMEELGAQICSDLLEATGYTVYFAGGGIANDEVINQAGELEADVLLVFGSVPDTVPLTRQMIDRMHDIGLAPATQIVVGGGVFNRANGLAEEVGADLWGKDPEELVQSIIENPDQRMTPKQRTVGHKRRKKRAA